MKQYEANAAARAASRVTGVDIDVEMAARPTGKVVPQFAAWRDGKRLGVAPAYRPEDALRLAREHA